MLKRKNKKGFTLAELLIVVAILAVLVAIAVPLFMGALNDAEKRVQDANKRAVKGAAVEEILMKSEYQKVGTNNANKWTVVAYVTAGGNIHDMTIKAEYSASDVTESSECTKLSANEDATAGKGLKDEYKVTLTITNLKVTAGS